MNQARKISGAEKIIFYVLILFLPTQLGKHFWPTFSQVLGIRIDYLSPTLYLTDLLIVLLFLLWIGRSNIQTIRQAGKNQISKIKYQKLTFSSKRLLWMFFFAYLGLNTLLATNPQLALYGLAKLLEMGFFGYYVSQIARTKKELSRIAFIAGICVIIECLLATAQYSHQASINGLFYFLGERKFTALTPGIANASVNGALVLRPYGTFSHPNVLSGYLICMMTLIYSFFDVRKSLVRKSIKLFALTLGSIVLLLSLSRAAIALGFIIVIVVLLGKLRKRGYRIFVGLFIISVVLVIGFTKLGFLDKLPFAARLLGTNFLEEAFIQRVDLIKSATMIIKDHPLLGVGLYNFIPNLSRAQKPISGIFYFQPVHNIYLLMNVEIGIFGFLFFLFFILKTYRRLIKSHKAHSKILILLISIILVLGMFDHYWLTLQQGQLLFAFTLGLCWSV